MAVEVTALRVSPEDACPIEAELALGVDFAVETDLTAARWEIRYIADHAHRRHVVDLGQTEPRALAKGSHTLEHVVREFCVSGLSKAVIINVGLLVLTLHDGLSELLQISLVVQVLEKDGAVYRIVLNPME
jgi:hypothetical protein